MSIESARKIVYARSHNVCEVQIPGVCYGTAGNWHHRRSAGRVWTPANGLHLCGSGTTGCHGWITEHPRDSRDHGWSLRSTEDWNLVPVWLHGSRWVWLSDTQPVYLERRMTTAR